MTDPSTASVPPTVTPAEVQKASGGRWTRRIQVIAGIALAVVFALIALAKFVTRSDLPGCDSTRAKDTLSDIFKRNNVDASRYDEIKTLTTGGAETTCNATLTLRDNSKLVIDYKLFKEGDSMKLLITRSVP